ncbi:MAG TPA: LysR family transcriptional regulator [Geminicoccaceae bacterium]
MDTLESMRVFAGVVDAGSFSEAARRLGISKALASKYVGQLEQRLGVCLLHRTTRKLTPTELGIAYYARCARIVGEIEELEGSVRAGHATPSGHLRIAGPRIFGEDALVGCVTAFLEKHPAVTVDLVLEERTVDIIAEGFDLAVRIGELADTRLIARRITSYRYVLCASPDYVARAGVPQTPEALAGHACIVNSAISPTNQWQFLIDGERRSVGIRPRIRVNCARPVRALALAGYGIGLCLLPTVREDIAAGRLLRLLEAQEAYDRLVYAVYPHSRYLPAKLRAFLDHLVDHFRAGPAR